MVVAHRGAAKSPLSHASYRVLLVMGYLADDQDQCRHPLATIAAEAQITQDSTRLAILRLLEEGLIYEIGAGQFGFRT